MNPQAAPAAVASTPRARRSNVLRAAAALFFASALWLVVYGNDARARARARTNDAGSREARAGLARR